MKDYWLILIELFYDPGGIVIRLSLEIYDVTNADNILLSSSYIKICCSSDHEFIE